MIKQILDEINLENGSNYKKSIVEKYKDNELFVRVVLMALDKVKFTYGITMKNVPNVTSVGDTNLSTVLDVFVNELVTRNVTGNAAIKLVYDMLSSLNKNDQYIIERILDRDLKINFGRSNFNKIFSSENQIVKPPYQRCAVLGDKTIKKIKFPALLQLKADGTYRSVMVDNGDVTIQTRSGEDSYLPLLVESFSKFPDGVYIGELLISGITNRSEANGLINSDNPPHEVIYIQMWDCISLEEWADAKHNNKDIERTPYIERFVKLQRNVKDDKRINIIPTIRVNSIQDALQQVSTWMNDGYEGGILKDYDGIFKDHTSPHQLKIKLCIDLEVRCVGFQEGTKGTKREKTFGALYFENDEGTIKGTCSGFSDEQLETINSSRDKYIGKVFTVQFNDLSKGRNNDYYALSHPRFIEFRDDKDTTDTLERAFELRDMAINWI